MLLAVEGGGFFSSSASGYSKGLSLLLLGQRKHQAENADKPMRVAPWNHYQLVDPDPDPDPNLQLASLKNRLSRGCASFVCLGRTSSDGLDSTSLKVGPVNQQDVSLDPLVIEKGKDRALEIDDNGGTGNVKKSNLKSSLKKPSNRVSLPTENVYQQHNASGEQGCNENPHTGSALSDRRKVQWTDVCGSELAEIREFEPSEMGGSDNEFDNGTERTCSCVIM